MKIYSVLTAAGVAALLFVAIIAPSNSRAQTLTTQINRANHNVSEEVAGIRIPDSALARDAAKLVRDTEGEFLFEHSTRVYYWAALAGKRKALDVDPELLYVAAIFHDFGLTAGYGDSHRRFEVDGANAARDFLRGHDLAEADIDKVWLAIALHTTNGISPHLFPLAALLAEGANMDLVGAGFADFTVAERSAVERAYRHPPNFAEDFMQAIYDGLKHRPETTQGTGLADVMAYEDPQFPRRDFGKLMRQSPWATEN